MTPELQAAVVADASLGHTDVRTTNAYLTTIVERRAAAMRRRDRHRANGFAQDSRKPTPEPSQRQRQVPLTC
jgi:predicted ATPase